MHNSETIHSYFSRVNQIKEQIEAIGDIVNGEEMVMTTLNGLPRSWDAFIQVICSRRKINEKLEGANNFKSCRYRESLLLE